MTSIATNQEPGQPSPPVRASTMGTCFFIASLGVLFAASLMLYAINRLRADEWPPPGQPPLPTFWLTLSTCILIGVSMLIHYALHSIRSDRRVRFRQALVATLVLAVLFLVSQGMAWSVMLKLKAYWSLSIYTATFYLITGLHALHVIGGLVPLALVTRGAYHDHYSADNYVPVKNLALYWHFLDAVWLVIFIVMVAIG